AFFGVFVWGDTLVVGPFWVILVCFALLFQNWYFFLLVISLFWVIRSFGEVLYWLLEQFAGKNRNPPHTLRFHKLFPGDAVWFIYQLFWQCVFVFSTLASLFFAKLWLHS